jgi:hypothetical protein
MASIATERNPSLYLLKDHLEAALGLGEELLAAELGLDAPDRQGLRAWMKQTRSLNDFLTSLRTLEYAVTARLLQARKRAEDLKRYDARLKPLIALLVAGTAPLADAAAELGDTDARDFDSEDTALPFLRSRGLLAPDAAGLDLVSRLTVGDDYQVAGRIGLGALLDLAAAFLDKLDLFYQADGEDSAGMRAVHGSRMAGGAPMEPSPAS